MVITAGKAETDGAFLIRDIRGTHHVEYKAGDDMAGILEKHFRKYPSVGVSIQQISDPPSLGQITKSVAKPLRPSWIAQGLWK
jgi:hypothetical protein